MKRVLGCIRRADADFALFEPGDRVMVGVSGGKDSLVLLYALSLYRQFSPHPFTLSAATLTLGLQPVDLSPIAALCQRLNVPYTVRDTQIGPIVFEQRREKHPCALCARLRRGALNALASETGANKVALGHHREDVLETFLLNLLYGGRLRTFSARTALPRAGVTIVRPLVYLPEAQAAHAAKALDLPVIPSGCPADGKTRRADMKRLCAQLCALTPRAKQQMLSAIREAGLLRPTQVGDSEESEEAPC